jgi:hypothetical protein
MPATGLGSIHHLPPITSYPIFRTALPARLSQPSRKQRVHTFFINTQILHKNTVM